MTKLGRFLRWAPTRRQAYVEALALSLAVKLGLKLLPFRTVRRLTRRLANRDDVAARGDEEDVVASRIVWAVGAANRRVPGTTCLVRGMTAQVLLRRQGIPASLRIGVTKDEIEGFRAHAWVESRGRILVGGSDPLLSRYELLAALDE